MALTKSQIRARIQSLTTQKNNNIAERTKYNNSLSYAKQLVKKIESSNSQMTTVNKYMNDYFTINKKTADEGKINQVKEQISSTLKKLNNTIIPSINSNINNLNNNINRLEREINSLRRQYETAPE